jgi:hypothetical protein
LRFRLVRRTSWRFFIPQSCPAHHIIDEPYPPNVFLAWKPTAIHDHYTVFFFQPAADQILQMQQQRITLPFSLPNELLQTSIAICRKLGFLLIEKCEFEYLPGHSMTVNDWRLGPL